MIRISSNIRTRSLMSVGGRPSSGPYIVGYNSIGGTSKNSIGYPYATIFTPDVSGTISKMLIYATGAQSFHQVAGAVYSDSSGPSVLRMHTSAISGDGTDKWHEFTSLTEDATGGLTVTNGVPIWLAAWTNNNGTDVKWVTDAGSVDQSQFILSGTFPTFVTTPSLGGTESLKLSIYLEIT